MSASGSYADSRRVIVPVIARRALWSVVKALKSEHVTILLTTHYLEEVEALSDRVAIMSNGKLAAIGTVEELTKLAHAKNFEDAFVALATGTEGIA